MAAGIVATSLSSYVIKNRTHNEVAAAIMAKHDTPAPRDVIGAIAIVEGAKKGESTLELSDVPSIKGSNIPLSLLLKALAADRVGTNSTAERPAIVQ